MSSLPKSICLSWVLTRKGHPPLAIIFAQAGCDELFKERPDWIYCDYTSYKYSVNDRIIIRWPTKLTQALSREQQNLEQKKNRCKWELIKICMMAGTDGELNAKVLQANCPFCWVARCQLRHAVGFVLTMPFEAVAWVNNWWNMTRSLGVTIVHLLPWQTTQTGARTLKCIVNVCLVRWLEQ